MNMLDDLYQEVLLEHKKRPRNCGRLQCVHRCAAGHNPLCGDSISVQLAESGDVLTDIAFEGQGCAICIASASLMTEAVKGPAAGRSEATERRHARPADARPARWTMPSRRTWASSPRCRACAAFRHASSARCWAGARWTNA